MLRNDAPRPSEEHRGYEIFYVAGERSWYYRADADAAPSRRSFRSAFQARRALDAELDAPPEEAKARRKRAG